MQVMVFVHARNATVKTATALRDLATSNGDIHLFEPEQSPQLGIAEKQVIICSAGADQCVHYLGEGRKEFLI